MKLA
ncbi:Protein of unknown function [Weissella confusa LBAE C39-2]|jgi:hypothetical protein